MRARFINKMDVPPDSHVNWWQFVPHGTLLAAMGVAYKVARDWVRGVNRKLSNKADVASVAEVSSRLDHKAEVATVAEVAEKKMDAAMFNAHRTSMENRLSELAARLERQDDMGDRRHKDNTDRLDAIHRRVDDILLKLSGYNR